MCLVLYSVSTSSQGTASTAIAHGKHSHSDVLSSRSRHHWIPCKISLFFSFFLFLFLKVYSPLIHFSFISFVIVFVVCLKLSRFACVVCEGLEGPDVGGPAWGSGAVEEAEEIPMGQTVSAILGGSGMIVGVRACGDVLRWSNCWEWDGCFLEDGIDGVLFSPISDLSSCHRSPQNPCPTWESVRLVGTKTGDLLEFSWIFQSAAWKSLLSLIPNGVITDWGCLLKMSKWCHKDFFLPNFQYDEFHVLQIILLWVWHGDPTLSFGMVKKDWMHACEWNRFQNEDDGSFHRKRLPDFLVSLLEFENIINKAMVVMIDRVTQFNGKNIILKHVNRIVQVKKHLLPMRWPWESDENENVEKIIMIWRRKNKNRIRIRTCYLVMWWV